MSKEVFQSMEKSLREAGAIIRGETPPSREFVYERLHTPQKPKTVLGICIKSDDDELLIPGKVYEVQMLTKHLSVIDENGEMVLCAFDSFVVVEFEPKVETLLREIVHR